MWEIHLKDGTVFLGKRCWPKEYWLGNGGDRFYRVIGNIASNPKPFPIGSLIYLGYASLSYRLKVGK